MEKIDGTKIYATIHTLKANIHRYIRLIEQGKCTVIGIQNTVKSSP